MVETLTYLGLGLVLGLKHALDADHLIAVATIVNERKGIRHAASIGKLWGLGHFLALMSAGIFVLGLQLQIPSRFASLVEFLVAFMLIVLGVQILWKARRGAILHVHSHKHKNHIHLHPHMHERGASAHSHPTSAAVHHHDHLSTRKPFFVGLIHGMAGSASLLLLTLTTIPSLSLGLLYIGVFGIGSLGGMVLMSMLMSYPISFLNQKFKNVAYTLSFGLGFASIGFGMLLIWQIGQSFL